MGLINSDCKLLNATKNAIPLVCLLFRYSCFVKHKVKVQQHSRFNWILTEVLTLLHHLIKLSCFLFNVYYKQVDGAAMGSPSGPTLVNLFLVYYEHKWLGNCPLQFRPKYYCKYVDNIFLMFESRDHVKKFLKYMNSCHPNIQLTCEEESNDKISLLDISVTRITNRLTASLYQKKSFSGVYLNLTSFLSIDCEKDLIHNLLFYSYNTCADHVTLHNEIEFLKSTWQRNSFPLFFIDNFIKKILDTLFFKWNISVAVSKTKKKK